MEEPKSFPCDHFLAHSPLPLNLCDCSLSIPTEREECLVLSPQGTAEPFQLTPFSEDFAVKVTAVCTSKYRKEAK